MHVQLEAVHVNAVDEVEKLRERVADAQVTRLHLEGLLLSHTNLINYQSDVADETVLADENEGNDALDGGDVSGAPLADPESLLIAQISADDKCELVAPDGIADVVDELVHGHVNEGSLGVSRVQLMQVLHHDLSLALSKIVLCHEEVLAEVSLGNLPE